MLDRLTSLERELRDVDAMLADPDVFSDQSRFVMLSKRRKELEPIVERSQELRQVTVDLETATEMFAELAGEDRETMRAEVDGAEQRIGELEGEIKVLLIPATPTTTATSSSRFAAPRAARGQPLRPRPVRDVPRFAARQAGGSR